MPKIGDRIKLKTWEDYSSREWPIWSWLAVDFAFDPQWPTSRETIGVTVLNGDSGTGIFGEVPLSAIQIPLNWKPSYDADEILSSDHKTFDVARESAIEIMEGRRTQ
jgi:hypothetical protein